MIVSEVGHFVSTFEDVGNNRFVLQTDFIDSKQRLPKFCLNKDIHTILGVVDVEKTKGKVIVRAEKRNQHFNNQLYILCGTDDVDNTKGSILPTRLGHAISSLNLLFENYVIDLPNELILVYKTEGRIRVSVLDEADELVRDEVLRTEEDIEEELTEVLINVLRRYSRLWLKLFDLDEAAKAYLIVLFNESDIVRRLIDEFKGELNGRLR